MHLLVIMNSTKPLAPKRPGRSRRALFIVLFIDVLILCGFVASVYFGKEGYDEASLWCSVLVSAVGIFLFVRHFGLKMVSLVLLGLAACSTSFSMMNDAQPLTPLCDKKDALGLREYHGERIRLGSRGAYASVNPVKNDSLIVVLSVGASTPGQMAEHLESKSDMSEGFIVINGNLGGQDVNDYLEQSDRLFKYADSRLAEWGLSPKDVDVVWTFQDDIRSNSDSFEVAVPALTSKLKSYVELIAQRYPSAKEIALSGRMQGFSLDKGHSKIQCWYQGWACRNVVMDYRSGTWDPGVRVSDSFYFFSKGEEVNRNGVSFIRSDFKADGVHLSPTGVPKAANFLNEYFIQHYGRAVY